MLGGVAGAFVAGGGVLLLPLSEDGLQPVITALKARPNRTTKDSFFIGEVSFTSSLKTTSKYSPHIAHDFPCLANDVDILHQIAETEIRHPALLAAQQFTGPA